MRRSVWCFATLVTAGCAPRDPPLDPAWTASEDLDRDGHPGVGRGGADCDDASPSVHPGAPERCDGVDNDCDGRVDDLDPDLIERPNRWYAVDADQDGFGSAPVQSCQVPPQALLRGEDCDDLTPGIFPGADEICDGVDNDCDGRVDDDDFPVLGTFSTWPDQDMDGFGALRAAYPACQVRQGFAPASGDCDDQDALVHPQAFDSLADGVDQDCDREEPWPWVATIQGDTVMRLPTSTASALATGVAIVFWMDGEGPHELVQSGNFQLSFGDGSWSVEDVGSGERWQFPVEPLPRGEWLSLRLRLEPMLDSARLEVTGREPLLVPWGYSDQLILGGRSSGAWYLWQVALTDGSPASTEAPLGLWPGPGILGTWHGTAASERWVSLEGELTISFPYDSWAPSTLPAPPPEELRP